MKKSIRKLVCVASMAMFIATSFCTVSADTVYWNLFNNDDGNDYNNRLSRTDEFGNVNAVVGTCIDCDDGAIGVDITIKSGSNHIGMIRPRQNESTKSYIQNISNCITITTLVSNGKGRSYGSITTSP